MEVPQITLSGFADEAAPHKTAVQQFSAFAALGLQYYTLRTIDAGDGPKNVLKLGKGEIQSIRHLQDEFGLNVASIGSPVGKVKLIDIEDGTQHEYVPFKKYLDRDVRKACELAHAFECKLIRGFSFYPPRGRQAADHIPQVVDQLGQIAEACLRSDLTFGVELEAETVGHNGPILAEIHRQIQNPALVLVFDGGNLAYQGFGTADIIEQFRLMKAGLGWLHIKDYRPPEGVRRTANADARRYFVPAGQGIVGYEAIFTELRELLPKLDGLLRRRGIPGVLVELEPHLLASDRNGARSGPDGMGVALRALCRVLDYVRIDYHLRDFDDIRIERGAD